MAFKEKLKRFWKDNWGYVVIIGGGVALGAAACYGMYKASIKSTEDYYKLLAEAEAETKAAKEKYEHEIEEKMAWKKEWDELGTNFENLTHQPFGDLTAEDNDYVDPFDGNCLIIAGPNSLYNDNPNTMEFYMLDKDGWYHRMPDELRSA